MTIIAGRYELIEKIGQGGMGAVFSARDTRTGELVAVKSLRADLANAALVERFVAEGEALRRLNHPNIVKMLDAVHENGQHYLVMELMTGGSLAGLLQREERLSVRRVVEIALDIADALTRAHRLEIIHRDIKPENVLLSPEGLPRLTDFGIARIGASQQTANDGAVLGTLAYIAPEVFGGSPVDARCDIWSFGVMLFQLLSGQQPFRGDTLPHIVNAILTAPLSDLEALAPQTPPALIDLIYRMLVKNPAERIPSVRLVGAELEAILQERPTGTTGRSLKVSRDFQETIRAERPFATTPVGGEKRHKLPARTTPFVGRGAELQQLAQLLADPAARLVTILAPGGMGKSSLALEAARTHADEFVNGVFLVELAPLQAAEDIVSTLVNALGIPALPGDPKTQVLDFLREKSSLLIFDNFEHVLAGSGLLSDILQAAPLVKILATSRERLNLSAERLFPLEGMDIPERSEQDHLLDYGAVQLFVQNARRLQPDFALHEQNAADVVKICSLVGGMPLGIVLAAAWLDALSLPEIVTEMSASLDFLETQMQDIPARQRSIRAVFEYSWALLGDDERRTFMRLTVFRGGMTREAAQAVTGASVRTLQTLVNKSLLQRDVAGGRYAVHELLRQYGEARLGQEVALNESTRDAHATYYADHSSRQEKRLWNREGSQCLLEMEQELENIRAAWAWAAEHGHLALIERSLSALELFFFLKGSFRAAGLLFAQTAAFLEAQYGEKAAPLVTRIRTQQAWMHAPLGDYARSRAIALEVLPHLEAYQLKVEVSIALNTLCYVEMMQGNYPEARRYGERSVQATENDPTSRHHTRALANLAYAVYLQGNYDEAEALNRQVLALLEKAGSPSARAYVSNNLGEILHTVRREEEAAALFEQAHAIFNEINNPYGAAFTLNNLGSIAHTRGDFVTARRYFEEALVIYREMGIRRGAANCLRVLGEVLVNIGAHDDGIRAMQEALHLYQEMGEQRGVADLLAVMGFSLATMGRFGEARPALEESLALRRQAGNVLDIADALLHCGQLALFMNDLETARHYHEEVDALIRGDDFPVQIANRHFYNLSILTMMEGRFSEALDYLKQAIEGVQRVGYRWAERIALDFIGECYLELGERSLAWENLRRSLQISHDIHSYDFGMDAVMNMARWLAGGGRRREAVAYLVFARDYPATWQFTRTRATTALDSLQAEMDEGEFAAAIMEGHRLQLEQVLAALLKPAAEV